MASRFYCDTRPCPLHWRRTHEARCPSCGGENTPLRRLVLTERVYVTPDVPEHYNTSLGRVVRSRRHLRQLQHDLGCQDFESSRISRGERFGPGGQRERIA